MAKKDYELDDNYDLNFDDMDGWDDEFGGDEDSPQGGPRTPASKIRTNLKQSAEQKYRDHKFRREVLKASLPNDYTSVLEDYDAVSKEVGDVWREQQKQWEKNRSGIKRAIRPYSDVIGKLGFKKLEEWANAEDRVSSGTPSDDEIDELKVQSLMADVFGDMQDKQTQHLTQLETARQEREDERYAEDVAERESNAKRSIEGNTYLSSINNNIKTLSDYTNKIDFQYKKRSLELQARLLVTQQRALTTLTSFRETAVKELQDIHKNTALPDYLKINNDEMITKVFKEKMAERFSAPFSGAASELSKRVFGKIKNKMADWWETIGSVVSSANDANEGFTDGMSGGDGTAWGGLKSMLGGAFSDWIVNKPAEWAKNKITPKIRDYLEKNHNVRVYGSNLKTMGSNFTDLFNEALKKGETGNKFLDGIINLFDLQEAAVGEKRSLWNKKDLDLEKSVYMDNRFKLSVTDVIPAWLKKIYGQVYGINNQGAEAPDVTWDFKSESFVATDELNRDTLEGLVDKESVKKQKESIHRWISAIGHGMSFSKKTTKFLEEWLLKKLRSSDAINPMLLLSDTLVAPKDVKAELETAITAAFQLTPKQVEIAKGGSLADIGKMISEGNFHANDRLNKSADAAADVKRQVLTIQQEKIIELSRTPEGRRALLKAGAVYDDGTGQYVYNYDFDDKILKNFEVARRREEKVGGKTIKEKVTHYTGRRAATDDGRSFLTDDQYEEMLDAKGFGDWEAGLKDNAEFGYGMEYLGYNDEKKLEAQIRRSLKSFDRAEDHPDYGKDFFITKDGKLITRANKAFLLLRKKYAPELHAKYSYASGGRIPSFASGGNNKLMAGTTKGQPGDEKLVKTHGGEFVVSHDAAKFNVQLLEAINKYGAPLINADGSVNSVYHKVFGFDKAKDFAKNAGKDFAVGAKNIKNEQAEIAVKSILNNINPAYATDYATIVKELTDAKIAPEKRLAKALKHWTAYQKVVIQKDGALAYGKNMARKGINVLNGKFDEWLDSDGTGTNIQIKNQILKAGGNLGRRAYNNVTNFASDVRDKAKSKMLDRSGTMDAISKTLAEVENPKMFILPIDLYFKGKGTPFVTKRGFQKGEYIDQNTGALIKNPSQITGTIVDREGSIVVSVDEMVDAEIVTRSGAPYRLLGMEEAHRKFYSATEYVANRYAVIASSQRMQDALKKGRDFRDKFLRDEAVDCYTRKDPITAKLRASVFREGGYIDQNTGNVLWTHHDITGPVTDLKGEVILTEDELADGLFDSKGEHLKINKLKQIRNMAFRRTAETYNRYAAKHVNRFKDGALNMMSKMGEKQVGLNFDDDPVDVYVKGESSPRITHAMFKSGKMLDVKSGKPIKSHSGIQGPVISAADASGNQLITDEDLKTGLVDAMGEDLYLPKMTSAGKRFSNYLKEAVLPKGKFGKIRNFFTMSPEKRLAEMHKLIDKYGVAFDVYVRGEPVTPRLTKLGFESSKYISQKTGLAVKLPEFIDGPVLDLDGNIILTAEEIEKGLLTIDGKKVKIGVDFKEGGLLNNLMGSASIMGRINGKRDMLLRGLGMNKPPEEPPEEKATERNVLYTIKFKSKKERPLSPEAARINNRMFTTADVKGGMLVRVDYEDGKSKTEIVDDVENIDRSTWLKSAMSNKITDGINFGAVFTMGGYIIDDEGKVIKTTYHTGKKKTIPVKLDATGAMPGKGMFGGVFDSILDKLGVKNRLGSWQQQREEKAKQKGEEVKKEEKKEKKDSWIGKLIKKLTLPLTMLFGGIASGLSATKAAMLGAVSWLGQSIVKGKVLGSLGSFMGKSGLGKALLIGGATYGGIKAYNYLDGDGSGPSSYGLNDRNAAYANLDTTSKVMNISDAAQAGPGKTSTGIMDAITNNPELAGALATGLMMMPGGLKHIGKGALAIGKKAWDWGGTALGWGGKKAAKVAGNVGGWAGKKAVKVGSKVTPKVLKTAGSVLKNSWRLSGGAGGLALRGLALAGTLAVPLLVGGLAFAAGYYGTKAVMKLWNNHKNPWNRFRMAQYGFNHNDEELMNKIAQIEGIATSLISINGDNQPTLKTDEKAMIEILKICGLYDKEGKPIKEQEERLPKFAVWFKERFLRVYSSYLRSLKKMRGKAEMMDLQKLNRQEQLQLLDEVHFKSLTMSPYVVLHSPFEKPNETEMDATDVDVIYRKLKNKIETSKDIKDGEVKDYSKIKNEDGLDDKTAKPLPKDATPEDKLKAEMDKQLDKTNPLKQDAKSMVDKANEVVKYQSDAANLLTKTHNAQIRAATDVATKETQKQFDDGAKSLSEKFRNFMSSMSNAISSKWDQAKENVGLSNNQASESNGGGLFGAIGDVINKGAGAITGKTKEIQLGVYKAFRNAGLSDGQAKIITAEVGRENDYLAKYVFGSHSDPANGKYNLGMLSWQGDRGKKLYDMLAKNGLIKGNQMVQDQKTLNAQAAFAVNEIRTNASYKPTLEQFLNNPKVDYQTGAKVLGTNFIRWRYNDSAYASHHKRRDNYFNQIRERVANGEVGAATGSTGNSSGSTPSTANSSAKGAPPAYLITGGSNRAGGGVASKPAQGIMGGAMANLDARYGKASASSATAPQQSNTVNVAGSADWNFDKIVRTALTNKLPKASGKCAEYVRKALTAGDLHGKIQKQFGGRLGHAFEYLAKLPKLGFNRVYSGSFLKGFSLMKGDVVVFDRGVYGSDNKSGGGWVYGHVAIWTGGNWVSDFVQSSIYPHSKYAAKGIPFTIFRANGIAKERVTECLLPGEEDFGKQLMTQSTPANSAEQKKQEAATQSTPEAVKVNNTVNNLNNGTATTSAVPVSAPQPTSPLESSGTEVVNLLGKQLKVQEEILSVLKGIAKATPVQGNASDSTRPGMTTPNISAVKNGKSQFDGVKNPVSVLKPV